MDLKPKKKTLKKLIKNAYKKNKFIKNILAILYKQEGYKVYYWLKQIRKLLYYNKSKYLIIDGLIYYRNQVFVLNSPEL
jgi:hypothetical protein